MTLYCVKMASSHPNVPDEIVGIFSAKTLQELAHLVDAVCNVRETEYAVLPSGGLIWEGRGPKVSDLYRWGNDDEDFVATIRDGEVSLSERLQFAFTDGLRFKPLAQLGKMNRTANRGQAER